ncbi:MAG: hypothetical protein WBN60_14725 [Polyangiales bacterium]
MKPVFFWSFILLGMAAASVAYGCASQTARVSEPCAPHVVKDVEIAYETREANVEVTWYDEWVSRFGKTLPEPLPPAPHWQHPILSGRYAGTMHEDSLSTDVSIFA